MDFLIKSSYNIYIINKRKDINNMEMQKMLKIAKAKNAIQKELIAYVEKNFEDFESMWFENLEEDFVSDYAIANEVSFAFDENLNVNIIDIYK